jgi:hypothetical protein
MSYLHHMSCGERHFLWTVFDNISRNRHDPYLATLHARYIKGGSGDLAGFANLKEACLSFIGLHLYLSISAAKEADQIIDANRLATEPGYAKDVASTIARATGLQVDLSDARQNIEHAGEKFVLPTCPPSELRELLGTAAIQLDRQRIAYDMELGERMVTELIAEERLHTFYTASIQRDFKSLTESLRSAQHEILDLQTRVAELEQRIKDMEASHSWRITGPLRGISSAFRH